MGKTIVAGEFMRGEAGVARRRFLGMAGAAAVTTFAAPALAARRLVRPRALAFENLHTGERLSAVYWADGRYMPDAIRSITWLFRDFRNEEAHPIDPGLLDLLAALHQRLGTNEPFQIISAYRSPETNAMLASYSDGVAQNSFHMQGRAIDIRVPGRPLRYLRGAAMSLHAGGVGYYPHSDFVHVDTGPIRHW